MFHRFARILAIPAGEERRTFLRPKGADILLRAVAIYSNFKETVQTTCVQHVREKFSWDRTVDRILAIYQDVLTKNGEMTRFA